MAWIKIAHSTPDKPEIVALADALGIDQDAAFGKCVRLWIWADQQTISGDAISVTESFLDRLTCCPGFASALQKVGWIRVKDGRIALPHFSRHNGETAKNRALSADRMRKKRDASSVTKASPDQIRSEKDHKKKNKTILGMVDAEHLMPAKPDPENLEATKAAVKKAAEFAFLEDDTYPYLKLDVFAIDWTAWLDMRRKMKWDNGPRALVLALNKLHKWPLEKAVLSLQLSIERTYRGVFEPKEEFNARQGNESAAQRNGRRFREELGKIAAGIGAGGDHEILPLLPQTDA
jgi:hypothetical protein